MSDEPSDSPAESPHEVKLPEGDAEMPSEEVQDAEIMPNKTELPSQATEVPSEQSRGTSELTQETAVREGSSQEEEHPPASLGSQSKSTLPIPRMNEEQSFSQEIVIKIQNSEKETSEKEIWVRQMDNQMPSKENTIEEEGLTKEPGADLRQDERPTPEAELVVWGDSEQHPVRQESKTSQEPAGTREEESTLSGNYAEGAAKEESPGGQIDMETSPKEGEPSKLLSPARILSPVDGAESVVFSAFPSMMFEDKTKEVSAHALNLSWVFGYNSKLPVFNLIDEEFRVILYISSHTAVIHDLQRNRQYHLQGHSSCISCICVSEDRRWIATADGGPESLVIVWDGYSAVPVHTIFDSHPEGGVCAIAISHDSRFLATVGAGTVQKVCIWKWTSPETEPVCSAELLLQYGFQDYIVFNSRDHYELVSNSTTQVIFYKWEGNSLQFHAPVLTDKTFDKDVGILSQSLFHFSTDQAITGTLEGKLVVWDAVNPPSKSATLYVKPYSMKAVKLVHLQKDGITALAVMDKMIVTCDVKGHVKFYDGNLQLLHWYSQFKLGSIRSISFSKKPACPLNTSQFPSSCTLTGQPLIIRNFILSTADAVVVHVATEGMKVRKCLEEPKGAVHAIACHPSKPLVAKGSSCGLLKVWHYELNKYLVSRIFKGESIRSICYNHDGSLLAAGFTDGSVYILDSISLEDDLEEPFKYARGQVVHISFSHDSQYLATADDNMSVTLYKQVILDEKKVWERLAALRAHYKPIRTLLFGLQLDSDKPCLLSLGEDRLLVEYDIENSAKEKLVVIRRDRIEQSAVPKYITWYPPLTKEYFFLTANDEYKMKLYNVTTKMCRKTVLGPTYGSPLEKIQVLPAVEGCDPEKRYLAYITTNQIGLQILPIDGNPHKSSAFICHPAGVSDFACSYDGCYIFTSGGSDLTVMKWDINLNALEAAVFLGGKDMAPFYNLLDGGRDGEFFRELEDYFYYAQLCHQGINTMEPRKVSTHIPLEQIPFVMRAMGFYPSEEQIENMLNEIKFSEYLETGKQVTEIDLGDFIKLYINHRPAFGLCFREIESAFQVLGYQNEKQEWSLNRSDLLLLLQQRGEHFTEEELEECLTTLLGTNPEGGRSEAGIYNPAGAEALIEEEIPEEITAVHFTAEILSLPVPEPALTGVEKTMETGNSDLTSNSF